MSAPQENGHRPTLHIDLANKQVREGDEITRFRKSAEWVIFSSVAQSPEGKAENEIKAEIIRTRPEVQVAQLSHSVHKINQKFPGHPEGLISRNDKIYHMNADVIIVEPKETRDSPATTELQQFPNTPGEQVVFMEPSESERRPLPKIKINPRELSITINDTPVILSRLQWRIINALSKAPEGLQDSQIGNYPTKHITVIMRNLRKIINHDQPPEEDPILMYRFDLEKGRMHWLNAEIVDKNNHAKEGNIDKAQQLDAVGFIVSHVIEGSTNELQPRHLKSWSPIPQTEAEDVDSIMVDAFLRSVEKLWNKGGGFSSEKEKHATEYCKSARIKGLDVRDIANALATRFDVKIPKRYLKK